MSAKTATTTRKPAKTRDRILDIAKELFAAQGYTGTSITDIASKLGTTPAALYYHFTSKSSILDALLAKPLGAYIELNDYAISGNRTVAELLGALIDFTAQTHDLIPIVGGDPAVRSLLDERLPHTPQEMFDAITAALAGPHPDRMASIRARAALAVVKEATLTALSLNNGVVDSADRQLILASALKMLEQ